MNQGNNQANKSSGMEASEDLSANPAMEKVFYIDMIFEHILKFVIFDRDVKKSKKMIQTVRLVQKHWLEKTSLLLRKSTLPAIVLNCDAKDKVHELDTIVETFTSPERLPNSILPLKLIFSRLYCREHNVTFLKYLPGLENDLVELQVSFTSGVTPNPPMIPHFTLPNLLRISFEFSGKRGNGNKKDFDGFARQEMSLLRQLLRISTNLRELVIPFTNSDLPYNFGKLRIPDSVSSLEVQVMEKTFLGIISNNKLPKLKHLSLRMPTELSESGELFKTLDRFKDSLRSFQVGTNHVYVSSDVVSFKIPKLENLEKIQIYGKGCMLDSESVAYLKELLPKVKNVGLDHQTEATLADWVRNSKFESVNCLSLSVLETSIRHHTTIFKSLSYEMLEKMHSGFPNLSSLAITVDTEDMNGLMYLYENMMQLKSLRIDFRHVQNEWKPMSTIIGLPVWLISANPEESDYLQSFIHKRGRQPCLTNLSELKNLTLWVETGPIQRNFPSDLLFTQAFLHMPNLERITLFKNMKVSERMEKVWKEPGRRIEYITVEDSD